MNGEEVDDVMEDMMTREGVMVISRSRARWLMAWSCLVGMLISAIVLGGAQVGIWLARPLVI